MATSRLKIDCDWLPPADWLLDYLDLIKRVVPNYKIALAKKSIGGRGYHFIIDMKEPVSDMEACRLQFLLGDDRTRCRLNFARIKAGIEGWNKLWSLKIKRK